MKKIIFALASIAFLFCSCNKDGGVDNKYAGQPVIGTWQQVDEYYHASVVELKANGEYSWTIAPIPMIRSTGTYVYKDNTITFNEQAWWQFERNDDSSTDGKWVRLSSLDDLDTHGIACKEVKIIEDHTSFMIWQFDEHTYFPGGRENEDDLKHPMFLQEDCKVKDSDIIGTWENATEFDANAKSYVVLGEDHSYISYRGNLVGGTDNKWQSIKTTGTWKITKEGLEITLLHYYASYKFDHYDQVAKENIYIYADVDPETLEAAQWLNSTPYKEPRVDTSRMVLADGKLYVGPAVWTKK